MRKGAFKIVAIASGAAFLLAACVVNPDTGERSFEPVEAVKIAAQKIDEVPDETKANVLEMLAIALGGTGAGVVLSGAAGYYRRRANAKKKVVSESEQFSGAGDELQRLAETCNNLQDDGFPKDESESEV